MRYYFDTSAVNAAMDDEIGPQGIIDGLSSHGQILVSTINIVEVGSTREPAARVKLMEALKILADGTRPAIFPNDALKRSLDVVAAGERSMNWSISEVEEGIWIALQKPELMTDQAAVDELRQYKDEQESWWRSLHEGARCQLKEIVGKEGDIFGSPLKFIRHYGNHDEFISDFFDELLANIGYPNFQGKARRLLNKIEPWTFYFGAMAHGSYSRAVQLQNYGHGRNPGGLDSQQAVYLSCCDVFVTNDEGQRKMLKGLRVFGQKRRSVVSYKAFRASVFGPSD